MTCSVVKIGSFWWCFYLKETGKWTIREKEKVIISPHLTPRAMYAYLLGFKKYIYKTRFGLGSSGEKEGALH